MCFSSSLRWNISTFAGWILTILPYIRTFLTLFVHRFNDEFHVNFVGKSSYRSSLASWPRTGHALAAKYSVSIVLEELSTSYWTAFLFGWKYTSCWPKSWTLSIITDGTIRTRGYSWILQCAYVALMYRLWVYWHISSRTSSPLGSWTVTMSPPFIWYLNKYFTECMLLQYSKLQWHPYFRRRYGEYGTTHVLSTLILRPLTNLYPTCPPPLGSSGARRRYRGYESSKIIVEGLKLLGNFFEHVGLLLFLVLHARPVLYPTPQGPWIILSITRSCNCLCWVPSTPILGISAEIILLMLCGVTWKFSNQIIMWTWGAPRFWNSIDDTYPMHLPNKLPLVTSSTISVYFAWKTLFNKSGRS